MFYKMIHTARIIRTTSTSSQNLWQIENIAPWTHNLSALYSSALLAQYHPWTSLERPNSNSGLPGTVRTQSEIDPNSVFLSIVLGSHDSPGTVVS